VYRSPSVGAHPSRSFPWARSIVVAVVPYLIDGDGVDGERDFPIGGGRPVARFADGDRYARVRSVLAQIAARLAAGGDRSEAVLDDNRLIDRAVAVRAGVAWSGKSTMVLAPGLGPWFLIGSVVTDASISPTKPMRRTCGSCTACIPACPTGAIVAPGVLDANRCLAAVLQRPGSIPVELRSAVGGRVYGCDDCLVACPPGDAALGDVLAAEPTLGARGVLAATDAELDRGLAHWYVPKRNMRFVRRNALIALGNTGNVSDLPVLAGYVGHPDPLLVEHAVWAVRRIGGAEAQAVIDALDAGSTVSRVTS
jgi:epoxyqueuosine reductase